MTDRTTDRHPVLHRTIGVGDQPHRWRIDGANGQTLSMSSEGYADERDRDHALVLTLEALLWGLDPEVVRPIVEAWHG